MFFGQAAFFFLLTELFTLFFVVGKIGFFKTFFLWLCSATLGGVIIQRQGLAVLMRAQGIFDRGGVPVDDLFDGLCLVMAGLLFLLPGFISDVFAFFLLIPFFRKTLKEKNPKGFGTRTTAGGRDDTIIDGTYVRVDETVETIEQRTPSNKQDSEI